MEQIVEVIYAGRAGWSDEVVRKAFSDAIQARYRNISDLTLRANAEKKFQLRVNSHTEDKAVPFAALVAPDQATSGPYGGMSLVVFPPDSDHENAPCLLAMVVGTHGLSPDDFVLGRPGHARKCAAIAAWQRATGGSPGAWAKQDPTRIDLKLPETVRRNLGAWTGATKSYDHVIYLVIPPPTDRNNDAMRDAVAALVDVFCEERGIEVRSDFRADANRLKDAWLGHLLRGVDASAVIDLLRSRRFAIVEGPPGTGKTRLALEVLAAEPYAGRGGVIQFHPGTTYESFVGGLGPSADAAGSLTFRPLPGHLMRACEAARKDPTRRHLLVIDEINRADLSKVLGEAIFLFEADETSRTVALAHDFPGNGTQLQLPDNLDVLGTMNSADRSIAILDVAVRRRFAFVSLHPQRSVVDQLAGQRMKDAFSALLGLFIEHAGPEAMSLMPGHAYFLADDAHAEQRLDTQLRPLLEEYLAQGYVAGFADEIRAYIDGLAARA
jgi:5-methylcytosine-specific restriction protein B